jgi:hypothetical protein
LSLRGWRSRVVASPGFAPEGSRPASAFRGRVLADRRCGKYDSKRRRIAERDLAVARAPLLLTLRQEWLMLNTGSLMRLLYLDLTVRLADVHPTLLAFGVLGSRGHSI